MSNRDSWFTPEWIFRGMGLRFTLDVASPEGGVPWIPASGWYSETQDGLAQDWGTGPVWLNPPYSKPAPWCERWASHSGGGVILIGADLSSSGQFVAFNSADAIWVPQGRIQFVNHNGTKTSSSPFTAVALARGDYAVEGLEHLGSLTGATRRLQ